MAKILVVDDSNELLEILTLLLEKEGYDVETASSKDKLKNQLSLFIPDLILLDVILNGADGRELCKEFKAKNFNKTIPVILISASPELLEDYEECHADDIIEKPFDFQIVLEKINRLLNEIN